MLLVLGVGSLVALVNAVATVIWDQLPRFKYWQIALFVSICGYLISLIYVTPVGDKLPPHWSALKSLIVYDFTGWTMDAEFGGSFRWHLPDLRPDHRRIDRYHVDLWPAELLQ